MIFKLKRGTLIIKIRAISQEGERENDDDGNNN